MWVFIVLGVMVAVVAAVAVTRSRRFAKQDVARAEQVRQLAREDADAFAEALRRPTVEASRASADPRAKEALTHADDCLRHATEGLDRARRPADFVRVTAPLAEGGHALACARALLAGEPPPPPRAPCFFDPRHGRSARDVEWSPDGRATGTVPACEADAQLVEAGDAPHARRLTLAGSETAYWNAPSWYAPWATGYFGGFASLGLPGRLFEHVPGPEWSPEELFYAGYKDAKGNMGGFLTGGDYRAGNLHGFDRS